MHDQNYEAFEQEIVRLKGEITERNAHILKLAHLAVDILDLACDGVQVEDMYNDSDLAIAQKRGAALEAITARLIDFEPDIEQSAGVPGA